MTSDQDRAAVDLASVVTLVYEGLLHECLSGFCLFLMACFFSDNFPNPRYYLLLHTCLQLLEKSPELAIPCSYNQDIFDVDFSCCLLAVLAVLCVFHSFLPFQTCIGHIM